MRFALWIAVLMFVLIIGVSLKVSSVKASVNPTPTPTIGNPVYGFQIGYSSSSGASYLPRDGEICILKHNLNASYLGSLSPNKSMLVVKFTSDAYGPLTANYVDCELPVTYSLTDRFNWYLTQLGSGYNLSNSDAYYVDGKTLQQVTLTISPTLTSTITSTPAASSTDTATNTATSTFTLTPTNTPTSTPTETSTSTYTGTPTSSYTATATNTATSTPTLTPTNTPTDTSTNTSTNTPSNTPTATYTNTASSTRTATVTSTTTATPVLVADKIVPINVSALHIPKAGDICYGQVVGNLGNKVVEFVADFQTGIEIRGGGCFTSKYYNLGQVLRYLESKGIRLGYESLPKPSLTPTRTINPTATIVRFLAIGLSTTGTKSVLIEANTICWGAKVGNIEYKVVKFQRSLSTPLNITKGGCTYGQNLSAEDVFNYLRRVFNTPLRGFVDVQ